MMIGIIFGSIWAILCFVLGCVLTFLMCKHFENKVSKLLPVPPKNIVSNNSLLDAVMPKIMNRPIHYDDEDDEDDDN